MQDLTNFIDMLFIEIEWKINHSSSIKRVENQHKSLQRFPQTGSMMLFLSKTLSPKNTHFFYKNTSLLEKDNT